MMLFSHTSPSSNQENQIEVQILLSKQDVTTTVHFVLSPIHEEKKYPDQYKK
jgi:hypothetical protein